MQAIKSFSDIEERVSDLVSAIIYVSHRHVVYEAPSLAIAEQCVSRLTDFQASTVSKGGNWFVSVLL